MLTSNKNLKSNKTAPYKNGVTDRDSSETVLKTIMIKCVQE